MRHNGASPTSSPARTRAIAQQDKHRRRSNQRMQGKMSGTQCEELRVIALVC
jgi:hypothetical protein